MVALAVTVAAEPGYDRRNAFSKRMTKRVAIPEFDKKRGDIDRRGYDKRGEDKRGEDKRGEDKRGEDKRGEDK
ncbi:2684_t:CDS:2, partial [Gigaspora margarita]